MQLDTLIQMVASYTGSPQVPQALSTAFRIALDAHSGYKRMNGEPFINHPLAVAHTLAEWHAPLPLVATSLLHDILNLNYSRGYALDSLRAKLGPEICHLIETTIELNRTLRELEDDFDAGVDVIAIQHYIASVLQHDADVLVLKIADRLHNLQTISSLERFVQDRAARIGFNLLAPLVDQLGMGAAKRQLENYCFEVFNPTPYQLVKQQYTDAQFHQTVQEILSELQQILRLLSPESEIRWSPVSLYALYYNQIGQNAKLGRSIRAEPSALRVIDAGSFVLLTNEEIDCYRMLGILHKHFPPVERQFRDFIGQAKENGYRSLHTQVRHPSGHILSVIIRTQDMDLIAERGITARWWKVPEEFLPSLPQETKSAEEKIQVFPPDGKIVNLPLGASVLDFAYSIHSDLGHRCAGALVNGRQEDRYHALHKGDRVEIISGGKDTQPELVWLKHVKTAHAISQIRRWLTQHQRNAMAECGRVLLDKELSSQGLNSGDAYTRELLLAIANKEGLESIEDLLVSIGVGRSKNHRVVEQLKFMRQKRDMLSTEPHYVVVVEALSRPGLASDISTIMTLSTVDMSGFSTYKRADGVMAEAHIHLSRTTAMQRSRIQKELESMPYITKVEIMPSSFSTVPLPQLPSSDPIYRPNPYGPTVAAGARFYGRETECQRISALLHNQAQNTTILLWGQKRIGKTSLMLRLQAQLRGSFLPIYIDVQGSTDSSAEQFLHQLMQRISTALKEAQAQVEQEISVPTLKNLRRDPLSHFDTFMALVQNVTTRRPLVVILDEFQCLCSLREEMVSREAIFSRLRSHAQHGRGIRFILSGGGLKSQLINQCNMVSLFNIAHDEKLGSLEHEAAYQLIKDGLTRVGNISSHAIELLLDLTDGHPFYLQLLCQMLYEQAQENRMVITADVASQYIRKWLTGADNSRFQHLWEGHDRISGHKNKIILSAIAELRSHHSEIDYQHLVGAVGSILPESDLIQILADLADLGVLEHNHANYRIKVDLFARWLRQHWPLEITIKEEAY